MTYKLKRTSEPQTLLVKELVSGRGNILVTLPALRLTTDTNELVVGRVRFTGRAGQTCWQEWLVCSTNQNDDREMQGLYPSVQAPSPAIHIQGGSSLFFAPRGRSLWASPRRQTPGHTCKGLCRSRLFNNAREGQTSSTQGDSCPSSPWKNYRMFLVSL